MTRLFVGNLPDDIQEQDLKKEFSYYGAVEKVEVKQKTNPETQEIQNTFAFVSLKADDSTINQCIQEFKNEKFRGRFLQISIARENFLEKLKREREEATSNTAHRVERKAERKETETLNVELPTIKSKKFDQTELSSSSSSESSSDSESELENVAAKSAKQNGTNKLSLEESDSESNDSNDDVLMLRKQSQKFLENGKIKIDKSVSTGEAIHVIERNKSQNGLKQDPTNEKAQKANQKRLESLKKLRNSHDVQKQAIKNALAKVDSGKANNKIVFDEDGTETEKQSTSKPATEPRAAQKNSKKVALFDDNDDVEMEDYGKDFAIKQQFQGEKGAKLMRLQSRFQNDARFKMDARFLEDENDNGNDARRLKPENRNESGNGDDEDDDDERKWQYDIIERVIGQKIRPDQPPKDSKKKISSMLRFDPTRADHTKFEEVKGKKRKKTRTDDIEAKKSKDNGEHGDEPLPVSMDQFYEVRGDLKKSLGSGGFSLLSMFGRNADDTNDNKTGNDEKPYEEKTIVKNTSKFLANLDPFKYDSSGDEADPAKTNKNMSSMKSNEKSVSSKRILHETFFVTESADERLADGILLFLPTEETNNSNTNEDNEAKRQELRNIVKRKIKKSVQNALPKRGKPNKRLKRFVKNL